MAELMAKGQRVVVTAGAAGIGRAIVEALVTAGAHVHTCDVDASALEACGRALPVGTTLADVSDEAEVDRLFDEVGRSLGGLDVLVNNAGIAGPTGAVEEIDPAEWRRCIEIDLTGQFLCAFVGRTAGLCATVRERPAFSGAAADVRRMAHPPRPRPEP